MARQLRVEYPGAVCHVMNRGDRREPIFQDDADRKRFVETLGEACAKSGWQVHACVLLPNPFHLMIETPQPNLVVGMKGLLGTYTSRFNRRHKLFGPLFSGRYTSLVVDGSGSGYLKSMGDDVHLDPAWANLAEAEQPLKSFAWSSWPEYLKRTGKRSPWLLSGHVGIFGEASVPASQRTLGSIGRFGSRRRPPPRTHWSKRELLFRLLGACQRAAHSISMHTY